MKSSHFYINKYIIINVLILSILTLNIRGTQAQVFDQDQPSFKTKWRQINNSQFQLIYPQEFEKSASLLAQRIEIMMRNASNDLKIKPRKISIIVQGNHIEQNGFAQLAPRKVELYSSPGPASDNTVWLNNLLQHELRHVAQFDKLTGKIKGPFFEQLALALYGIHLPAWYFEGDAVAIETQFSNGGRGRSSSWMMPLKANLLAGKNYDFNKNVLGSFKDITPSYYLTGYLMNSYLSNHFGEEVKERILERMRRHLLRPFNFNLALKKETDLYSSQLYKHSISAWKEELEAQSPEPETALLFPQDDRYYSNYLLPQTNSSGRIYSLIESPQRTPEIAEISEQKPKTLIKLGFQLRPYFNINNNHIVWDEIRRDSRFGKQTYNILRIYDIRSKKTWNLSKNSRLYSPVIDSNSENIYAINVDQDNVSSLVKINLRSKQQVELFHLADGSQLQQPAISPDNQKILLICISEKGNNLIEYDLQKGEWTALLPWSNQEFERPNYLQEDIIFRAQVGQIDQLVQLDRKQNQLFQLGHSAIGNSSASSFKPSEILYNNYRFNGYKVAKMQMDSIEKTAISLETYSLAIFDQHLKQPYFLDSASNSGSFSSKKYHPISDFFNFHSLSISANNFESFDNYKPGIYWIANDLLNTSQVKLGYEYDLEREKSSYSAEILYQRYLPKLSIAYKNRGMIGQARSGNNGSQTINFDYREHVYTLDLQIPLQLYRGITLYSYGVNVGTSYQKRYDLSLNNLKNFQYEIAFPLNYQVYFNRNQRRAAMDLIPRWGQNISVVYRHVPFSKSMKGQIIVLKSNFYFPGFFPNHGFQARFSYQHGDGRYNGSNELPMVGGFAHFESEKVDNTLLLNYRFPIAYPDWSIGPLAYIKRFHGYLFADYQNLQHSGIDPVSMGIGLSMDFNLLRYKLPDFGVGTKLSYINHPSARGKIVPSFSFNYNY